MGVEVSKTRPSFSVRAKARDVFDELADWKELKTEGLSARAIEMAAERTAVAAASLCHELESDIAWSRRNNPTGARFVAAALRRVLKHLPEESPHHQFIKEKMDALKSSVADVRAA